MNKLYVQSAGTLIAGLALVIVPAFALAQNEQQMKLTPPPAGISREVDINNNGAVLVRGAQVTAISGSDFTAQTIWGNSTITWTVKTASTTNFTRNPGDSIALSDFAAGNYISFSGAIESGAGPFTVNANVVKDWSLTNTHASFTGTIASVNVSAQSFMLQTLENGTITIQTANDTKYLPNGIFGNLVTNNKVTVAGNYASTTKVLSADSVYLYNNPPLPVAQGHWDDFLSNIKAHIGSFFQNKDPNDGKGADKK